jgi:hypothetical protein
MKIGDEVTVIGRPELGTGKIVRFYANQSTILVDFENRENLTYCDYESVEHSDSQLGGLVAQHFLGERE